MDDKYVIHSVKRELDRRISFRRDGTVRGDYDRKLHQQIKDFEDLWRLGRVCLDSAGRHGSNFLDPSTLRSIYRYMDELLH